VAIITIGGNDFSVYETVAEIDVYASAAVGDAATAWNAADPIAKPPPAVSASRLLDRQTWQGAKTDPTQAEAFPRTGLYYIDGTPVPSDVVPQQVLDANSELAMDLLSGAAVQTDPSTQQQTRRLKAGSVEIEYFNLPGTGTRFPLAVMELIGLWLGGGSDALGSESTGTCAPAFDNDFGFVRGI